MYINQGRCDICKLQIQKDLEKILTGLCEKLLTVTVKHAGSPEQS